VIFAFQRAYDYMAKTFSKNKNVLEIVKIDGVNFIYEDNEFKFGKTVIRESKEKLRKMILNNFRIYIQRILKYSPSLLISDGEPSGNLFSRLLKIPLICIDNINVVTKCELDCKLKNKLQAMFLGGVSKGKFNFISTIFEVKIKKKYERNTFIIGPIIRKNIMKKKTTTKSHILVYQTSKSNEKMFEVLRKADSRFIIYGFEKDYIDHNLVFKKASKSGFMEDLASCKGIITNGGYSLISEAVVLGKPIYSIPVKKQVEQAVNGFYIQKLGYGIHSEEINLNDLNEFIETLPTYKENLKRFRFKVNDFKLFDQKVDVLIKSYKQPRRTKMLELVEKERKKLKKKYKILDIKKRKKLVSSLKKNLKKRLRL